MTCDRSHAWRAQHGRLRLQPFGPLLAHKDEVASLSPTSVGHVARLDAPDALPTLSAAVLIAVFATTARSQTSSGTLLPERSSGSLVETRRQ